MTPDARELKRWKAACKKAGRLLRTWMKRNGYWWKTTTPRVRGVTMYLEEGNLEMLEDMTAKRKAKGSKKS